MVNHSLLVLIPALLVFALPAAAASPFSVRDFGAAGDGKALDTASVQQAIDACAAAGGGSVLFTAGSYRCGTIHMKTGVTLSIERDATLLGSKDDADYLPVETLPFPNDADVETSFFQHALILGEAVEHIAVVGPGTIDANRDKRGGPKPISLKRCRDVTLRDLRILNAPNYTVSLLGTDDVDISGLTILNGYADGIDPDSCRNVRISNCHVETVDDAICLKTSFSLGERRACEDITVTNCSMLTRCNAFKIGTETGGDVRRVSVRNCAAKGGMRRSPALSGVSIESVDGANIEDVTIENVAMSDVRAPFFIRLGNRGRDQKTPTPGTLRNVHLRNISAERASVACSIAGIFGHCVEDVSISNVQMQFYGGNPMQPSDVPVSELEDHYPESVMWGPLPAYAIFCRHARGVVFEQMNITCSDPFWRLRTNIYRDVFWPENGLQPTLSDPGDPGHAVFCEDVANLAFDRITVQAGQAGMPLLRFNNVREVRIEAVQVMGAARALLEVAGPESATIRIKAIILPKDTKPVVCLEGTKADAVLIEQ